jgi:hypothetical protein
MVYCDETAPYTPTMYTQSEQASSSIAEMVTDWPESDCTEDHWAC